MFIANNETVDPTLHLYVNFFTSMYAQRSCNLGEIALFCFKGELCYLYLKRLRETQNDKTPSYLHYWRVSQ